MTDANKQSRVLTLVFTDLVSSTALKTERGDDVVGDLIARHREQVTRLADDCAGRVIDWAGDGCFLTFDTSSAAVMFALRLQQAHADEADLPEVRIGVHMGEVTEKPGPGEALRIEGLAVDIAARVSSLANPGQVLLSSAVYDSARQRLGVDALGQPVLWQTHGAYTLKGFDKPLEIGEAGLKDLSPLTAPEASEKARPVSASQHESTVKRHSPVPSRRYTVPILAGLCVFVVAAAAYILGRTSDSPDIPVSLDSSITSIAVLPLENQSGDPEQAYFADGLTDTLTAELAKIGSIRVISRTSTLKYRNTTKSIPEIAAELGVDALIEGSVYLAGNDVRIAAQLIDGSTDSHLWADTYTGTLENVIALQGEVALTIAKEIGATLTPDEQRRLTTADDVSPEAYRAYLRGLNAMAELSLEGIPKAFRHLEEAISLDPDFAMAHSELAFAHFLSQGFALSSPADSYPKMLTHATRAVALDDTLGEAHSMLGLVNLFYAWDWETADRELLLGTELAPNSAPARAYYALYLMRAGRLTEALEESVLARQLDAEWPLALATLTGTYWLMGDTPRAIDLLSEAAESIPDDWTNFATMAVFHAFSDDESSAHEAIEKMDAILGTDSPLSVMFRGVSEAQLGRPTEALAALEELPSGFRDHPSIAGVWATLYALAGEFDRAFESLNRLLDFKSPDALELRFPTSASLRSDPRYWDLLERVGYPPLPPDHPGYAEEQSWLARKAAAEQANAPIEKIAVLPFDNMSSDPEQVYFVDGMTEALIAELAKVKSIKVISRTSIMQYKDTDKSLPEIARELDVDALIEGSVMKADNDVRITAQLVHGITDEHLWAETYTNTLENVFKLQAEVALAIVDEINAVVTPDERSRIESAKPVNPEAYELYVQGRNLWSLRTEEGLQQSRRLFERALELDESFALAHVGLADAYIILFEYGYHARDDASRHAREQIELALAIDPDLGEAYTSLGMFKLQFDWNPEEAEESYQRGIELSPGHATGHQWYAGLLATQSRHEEQLAQAQAAYELDPASPIVGIQFAEALACVDRYDEAQKMAEGLRTLHPGLPRIREGLFTILSLAGRFEDALIYYESPMASDDDASSYYVEKAYLLAVTGKDSDARRILNDYIERVDHEGSDLLGIAAVYTALGEYDEALAWIERGYDIRQSIIGQILWYPGLRPLYDEPRFQAVLEKMNLPDPRGVN